MLTRDQVFRGAGRVVDFTFDAAVSRVFDDMVSRSVPYYTDIQRLQTELAVEFLPEGDSVVCDVGCSTGTTIALLASHPRCPAGARFVGIDNSPHMLAEARAKLDQPLAQRRVELLEADLNAGIELPACNVLLMNWTLQFVRPIYRESLVQKVHAALRPGGALFLSEKVLVSDSMLNRLYIDLYLRYKMEQGYTNEELQRKREALENVLVPYRIDENVALLQRCGFRTVDTYFRWINFACLVAVKR